MLAPANNKASLLRGRGPHFKSQPHRPSGAVGEGTSSLLSISPKAKTQTARQGRGTLRENAPRNPAPGFDMRPIARLRRRTAPASHIPTWWPPDRRDARIPHRIARRRDSDRSLRGQAESRAIHCQNLLYGAGDSNSAQKPLLGRCAFGTESPSLGMRIFHPELLSGGNRTCPSPSMMILLGPGGQRFAIVVGLGGVSPRHVISDGLVSWNISLHRPRCCWPAFISRSSCTTIGSTGSSRPHRPGTLRLSELPGDPRPVG